MSTSTLRPPLMKAPRARSLELESALLRDPLARGVLGHDHQRDAVDLLRPEQVVDQEAYRLGRVTLAGVLLPVQLVGELVRVPVVDRSEEFDVADHDVVPVPDEEGALIPLPEACLGVVPPEHWLRLDAEGEERAAVGDLGVRVDECREIALTHRTQHDLVPVEHGWPLSHIPHSHRPRTHGQPSGVVRHQDQLPASPGLEDPAVRGRRLAQRQLLADHRHEGAAAQLGRQRRERARRLRLRGVP